MGKRALTLKNLKEFRKFYAVLGSDEIVEVKARIRERYELLWNKGEVIKKSKLADGNYEKIVKYKSSKRNNGYQIKLYVDGALLHTEMLYYVRDQICPCSGRQRAYTARTYFDLDEAERAVAHAKAQREKEKRERAKKISCSALKKELIKVEERLAEINRQLGRNGK